MISGNHFHPFPHVWLQRKIQFSGNCIPVDHNFPLWLGNEFTFSFSLQFISGSLSRTATQRERDCSSSDPHFRWTIHSDPHFISPIHEPERSNPRTATQSEIDQDRDLATARDRAVDRDLRRELAPARSRSLMVFYLGLCFPFSFPNTRKYFLENFLKCNQTQRNIFLFRKLAFSENMYFPENILRQPNTA